MSEPGAEPLFWLGKRPSRLVCSINLGLTSALSRFAPCRSVTQLSIDWQVLQQALPAEGVPAGAELPPRCRQLALAGSDGGLMCSLIGALPRLPVLLPELRELILEPDAQEALWEERRGGRGTSALQRVGGRWLPTRLPGSQPAQQQQPHRQSVLQQLRAAGVEARDLMAPEQLPAMLDELPAAAAAGEGRLRD